jgi:hypothetical protein
MCSHFLMIGPRERESGDEALRLFGNHGPDAVTLRDIAAAAGVSPALVVRHYGPRMGCAGRSTTTSPESSR